MLDKIILGVVGLLGSFGGYSLIAKRLVSEEDHAVDLLVNAIRSGTLKSRYPTLYAVLKAHKNDIINAVAEPAVELKKDLGGQQ